MRLKESIAYNRLNHLPTPMGCMFGGCVHFILETTGNSLAGVEQLGKTHTHILEFPHAECGVLFHLRTSKQPFTVDICASVQSSADGVCT